MYEVYHYDDEDKLVQIANVDSNKNLSIFKENQVSCGETAYIYCAATGEKIEVFTK